MKSKFKRRLLHLYPDCTNVYGPYKRKDGRKHVVLYTGTKTKTLSWPKAKMEVKLKRKLAPHETVDHKDEDYTNNKYANLEVLSRKANIRKNLDHRFGKKPKCKRCGVKLRSRRGIFCSNSCRGKHHGNQYM